LIQRVLAALAVRFNDEAVSVESDRFQRGANCKTLVKNCDPKWPSFSFL
jgi:hypothetical protein